MNQISWKRCGELAEGKPVRAAQLGGRQVPFNRAGASESKLIGLRSSPGMGEPSPRDRARRSPQSGPLRGGTACREASAVQWLGNQAHGNEARKTTVGSPERAARHPGGCGVKARMESCRGKNDMECASAHPARVIGRVVRASIQMRSNGRA